MHELVDESHLQRFGRAGSPAAQFIDRPCNQVLGSLRHEGDLFTRLECALLALRREIRMSQSGELIEPIEPMNFAGHDEASMRREGSTLKLVHKEKFVHQDFIRCLTRRPGCSHA